MTLQGRYVAVVGPADGARPSDLGTAEEVGRRLAEAGAVVLTGGHHGVMQAAARGARDAGGTSIGLMPGHDRAEGTPEDVGTVVADATGAIEALTTLRPRDPSLEA